MFLLKRLLKFLTDKVDKRDWELNQASLVYHFGEQSFEREFSVTCEAKNIRRIFTINGTCIDR